MTIWIKIKEDNTVEGSYIAPMNLTEEEQAEWITKEYDGTFVSSIVNGEKYPFEGDVTLYTYDPENKTFIAPVNMEENNGN